MEKLPFSDVVGIGGIALATVLLVLDKAGKLKGGWLFGLLCLAGAMTLFIAVGNSWVMDSPHKWRLWRGALMVCGVGLSYSGLAIWISAGEAPLKRTSSGTDEVSHIEQLLGAVPDSSYRQLVASVMYALDPHATLSVGNLVATVDGARTVDIELRSSGKDDAPSLVAIDVIDLPSGRKADITAVDAADSKRTDIKADAMLLCSNTGFQQDAISKAKRKNIGLISVLRQGDTRVKAVIEEEIYFRRIDITPVTITWNGDNLQNLNPDPDVLEYNGGSVVAWLRLKASLIAGLNPELTFGITDIFNFKQPTNFYKNGKRITLKSVAVSFTPRVQWVSQLVQIDARAGIYDYVRGKVRLTPGSNSYTISGIDFDRGTPLSTPPPPSALGIGVKPGEPDLSLTTVHGTPPKGTRIANLDDLVRPEDLSLKLTQEELKKLRRSTQ